MDCAAGYLIFHFILDVSQKPNLCTLIRLLQQQVCAAAMLRYTLRIAKIYLSYCKRSNQQSSSQGQSTSQYRNGFGLKAGLKLLPPLSAPEDNRQASLRPPCLLYTSRIEIRPYTAAIYMYTNPSAKCTSCANAQKI